MDRSLIVEEPIRSLPVLFLWPHSNCNCRCIMCEIWRLKLLSGITTTDLESWKQDWSALGVRHVVLTGGEALMHPQFGELCEILRQQNIGITLLSTGLLLNRFAEMVVRYISRINVSLDGPREVHDRVRRLPRAFDKLAAGVASIKAIAPDLPIFARSVVHRLNCGHLRQTVRAAHEIGLDGISFLATDVTSEAFNRPGGWNEEQASSLRLGPTDIQILGDELDGLGRECAQEFHSGFICEPLSLLRLRLLRYFKAHLGEGDFAPNICNAPWASALVEFDGTVRPCFFQPPYGNLFTTGSLSEVINSPTARAFRSRLDVTADPICKRCVCSLAVYRCECGASRKPPYCDNTCDLLALLRELGEVQAAQESKSGQNPE